MGAEHKAYRWTPAQADKVRNRPRISGKFAIEKGLWEGRRVTAYFLMNRGDLRHTTDMRFAYGTLVLNPNGADAKTSQIGLRQPDGSVYVIAASRVKDLYDMTRTKVTS